MKKIEPRLPADFDDPGAESAPTWPFTEAELAEIATKVANPRGSPWVDAMICAARDFVYSQYSRDRTGKPHARDELCKLKAAFDELWEAIRATGFEARNHLNKHIRPSPKEPPFTIDSLIHALWRFHYSNRTGFEELPQVPRGGPRDTHHERALFLALKAAWELGNFGEKTPPFNAFRDACIEPLRLRHGFRPPSEKGKQDKTRPRKRRPKQPE